ncbi:cation transporter [Candidatus Woesearchaeota archaeon]|nr:cation transporter [Candidatus Woesearchaeota archaeon]
MKTTLTIQGMHCTSCKMLIEDACADIPGVISCKVDAASGKAVVEHEKGFDIGRVKKEIEKLGTYKVK